VTDTAHATTGPPIATTRAGRLRRIRAVVTDDNLTAGEARVIVLVILYGNCDGLAWPGQRRLKREAHASGPVVVKALRRAVECEHLAPAGRKEHGTAAWLILDVPPDSDENNGAACRKGYTLKDSPSAPHSRHAETRPAHHIDTGQRTTSDDSACHIEGSSAPSSRHENYEPIEPQRKEGTGCAGPSLTTSLPTDGNNGNGDARKRNAQGPDARLLALYESRLGRPCRDGERTKFAEAVREARAAGTTDPMIANAVAEAQDTAPWTGPNAAKTAARELIKSWESGDFGEERKTVRAILDDIAFVGRYAAGREGPTVSEGLYRVERVQAWADRHLKTLRAAHIWPDDVAGGERLFAPRNLWPPEADAGAVPAEPSADTPDAEAVPAPDA